MRFLLLILFAGAVSAQSPTTYYLEGVKAGLLQSDERARGWFTKALEVDSTHVASLVGMAMVSETGLDYMRRAYRHDPDDEWLKRQFTQVLLANGRMGEIARVNADDYGVVDAAARTLLEHGRVAGAVKVYRDYITDTTSFPDPYLMVVDGEMFLEHPRAAQKWAAAALAKFPASAEVHASAGTMYGDLGNDRRAAAFYEQALRLDPENTLALNNLAYIFARQNRNLRRALEMSSRAVEREPDNAAYLDTYGWILYRLGRLEEARTALRHAVSIYESSETMQHYSEVLRALGEDFMAEYYLNKSEE